MTRTLGHITKDLVATQTELELTQGEIDLTLEDEIETLSKELEVKTDHYAYRIEKLTVMAEFWRTKAKEAQDIAKGIDTHIHNMKERIKATMIILDKKEINGDTHKISIRPTAKAKLVVADDLVPPDYLMQVVTTVPDKERLRLELELGSHIPGARLEQGMTLNIGYKK